MNDSERNNLREQIDRLVDGELNESDERQLLGRLDDEPDGWRRCALAFVESQNWRREFALATSESNMFESALPAKISQTRGTRSHIILAMAASFLVAWGLGSALLWLSHGWPLYDRNGGSIASGKDRSPKRNTAVGEDQFDKRESDNDAVTHPNSVKLVVGDEPDDMEVIDLPIVENANADETWLSDREPVFPEDVRQALERMGHEVQRQRRFYPFQLNDGRQLVLPVDDVKVQFVGNRGYQ